MELDWPTGGVAWRPDEAAAREEAVRARYLLEEGEAAQLLDVFLARQADSREAAEGFWLSGWLRHLEGRDQDAAETWRRGIALHPPWKRLFSQKAYFTLIRFNWDLPDNVDQEP